MAKIPQYLLEKEVAEFVLKTKKHFEELRTLAGYDDEWAMCEQVYFNGAQSKMYDGLSKVNTGELHTQVERVVPKYDKVIFPSDGKFLTIKPKNPKDQNEDYASKCTETLLTTQSEDINMRSKMMSIYRSEGIYGTVFVKTFWNHKEVKKYIRENGKRVEQFATTINGPDFDELNIRDVYIDPADENLEGAVIQAVDVDYHKLWQNRRQTIDGQEVGLYTNVEQLKEVKITTELDPNKVISNAIKGLTSHSYSPFEKKIKALEYWGPVPLYFITADDKDKDEGEVVENALIIVTDENSGSGTVLVPPQDNPYDHQEKPFLRARYIKVNGRAYGLGIISRVTIPLEQELNSLRQQLHDNRTFMLRKKWIKDKNSGISNEQLKDVHNLVIDANDINSLREVVTHDFTQTGVVAEQNMRQGLQAATGVTSFLGGTPQGASLERTAGGINTMQSASLERFELVITAFEEDLLLPMMEQFWALNQQYLPEGADVQLIGKPLVRVIPAEIPLKGDMHFGGIKELGSKELKINQLGSLIQNIIPFAQLGADPMPVLFAMIDLMGFGDLKDKIDKRPESQLEYTPEGEVQMLMMGQMPKVDFNDNHDAYMQAYQELLQKPDLPDNVRKNTTEIMGQRMIAKQAIMILQRHVAEPAPPTI